MNYTQKRNNKMKQEYCLTAAIMCVFLLLLVLLFWNILTSDGTAFQSVNNYLSE
mgnify:CR=1 FL=1